MSLDYNCAASLHQKRTLAFINHFIMKSVQFLNNFACQCEMKLMNFELKMQKIEASLKILESKLSSIPDIKEPLKEPSSTVESVTDVTKSSMEIETVLIQEISNEVPKEKPMRDPRYERFFKMVQVGVPVEAVKLKIIQEGLDPSLLDEH